MWTMFGRIQSIMNVCAALLILALMLMISADVIGRAVFSSPLYGVPELTKFSIVCIAWLQMAYTLRQDKHLRSTLLLDALPRLPRRAMIVLNCVMGAAMMSIIAWYSWPEMLRAYANGVFEGEHPVRVPVWPIWGIVILGAGTMALEYAGQAVQAILRDPQRRVDDDIPGIG
jgi:TRAP-type C4-dicarboxylate transport system permease small subunit